MGVIKRINAQEGSAFGLSDDRKYVAVFYQKVKLFECNIELAWDLLKTGLKELEITEEENQGLWRRKQEALKLLEGEDEKSLHSEQE